jgi:hypothetical protein
MRAGPRREAPREAREAPRYYPAPPPRDPFLVRDAQGVIWQYESRAEYELDLEERMAARDRMHARYSRGDGSGGGGGGGGSGGSALGPPLPQRRQRSRSRERPSGAAGGGGAGGGGGPSFTSDSGSSSARGGASAPSAAAAASPPAPLPSHEEQALAKAFKAQVRDVVMAELRKVFVEGGEEAEEGAGGGAGAAPRDPGRIHSREEFKRQARRCTDKLYDLLWLTGGRTGGVAIRAAAPSAGGCGRFTSERRAWGQDFCARFLSERERFHRSQAAAAGAAGAAEPSAAAAAASSSSSAAEPSAAAAASAADGEGQQQLQ